jgi:hypothetical protein
MQRKKASVFGNNKGQAMVLGLMLALFVFAFALICIQPLKELIVISRDSNHLDCSNTSISTGQSATCLIVDLYLPYFIGVILVGAGAWVLARQAAG